MAIKFRSSERKKTGRMGNLKTVVAKIEKSVFLSRKSHSNYSKDPDVLVPEDVKEGHFAVIATGDGQPKRYVIALSYLSHPAFQRLLEKAAEEYGFDHDGALTIPCGSNELESILAQRWKKDRVTNDHANTVSNWASCQTMVESC